MFHEPNETALDINRLSQLPIHINFMPVIWKSIVCMNCHTVARKEKPEIIKLTQYYEEGIPLPWKRIHKVPEYAYFNHSVHVNKGIKCESCHGNIYEMEKVQQVRGFTMTACLECHRNPEEHLPYLEKVNKGPENCAACHR